jgi:hypothetical protein
VTEGTWQPKPEVVGICFGDNVTTRVPATTLAVQVVNPPVQLAAWFGATENPTKLVTSMESMSLLPFVAAPVTLKWSIETWPLRTGCTRTKVPLAKFPERTTSTRANKRKSRVKQMGIEHEGLAGTLRQCDVFKNFKAPKTEATASAIITET